MISRMTNDNLSKKVDKVGEVIAGRTCLVFSAREKIDYIVKEMNAYHQGVVGIVDDSGDFLGILTERDILKKIFGKHEETQAEYDLRNKELSIYPDSLKAEDIMIQDPICLYEDMQVEEALDIINAYGFRYMPVVKREVPRKLTGIADEREIFWHVQNKTKRKIEEQNSLLNYFMHFEPYGSCYTASCNCDLDNNVA